MSELKVEIYGIKEYRLLGPTGRQFIDAGVKLPNGDYLGVSQYKNEFPHWGVDAAFKANGYPLWSNGAGGRESKVRAVNAELEAALNDAVKDAGVTL